MKGLKFYLLALAVASKLDHVLAVVAFAAVLGLTSFANVASNLTNLKRVLATRSLGNLIHKHESEE